MTIYQFKGLSTEVQLELVLTTAVQVSEREDENASYVLYQLDAFYIELSLLNNTATTTIKTFNTTNLLEPYLKDINIDLY